MDLVRNTFILVAEDCPVETGVVPPLRGGKPTVASLEYALLARHPYRLTQPDLVVDVETERRGLGNCLAPDERAALQAALFAKPRACMRASPLAKSYGWGVHHDAEGRIALFSCGSEDYARLARETGSQEGGSVVKAMRSKRA